MRTTQRGINLIKEFESFVSPPRLCPAGYLTGGWGHVILPGEDLQEIDPDTGETLLLGDIAKAERAMERLIKVPLDDCQWDALVSFTFNLGGGALQRSSLRAKLSREEYLDAANEFPKWCYAGGRKLQGLLKRRLIERRLFLEGD